MRCAWMSLVAQAAVGGEATGCRGGLAEVATTGVVETGRC
jgi:hypothetical protein